MTNDERDIIHHAVKNALCFGTGILTNSREELEDYGYTWTEEHEAYVFSNYIERDGFCEDGTND